jgi:hypothetical protein
LARSGEPGLLPEAIVFPKSAQVWNAKVRREELRMPQVILSP